MIPESEIRECPEHAVKSKIENIFVNEKILENILLGFIKPILIFVRITKKKYKLTKMGVNIYYLELIIILLNIFQPQKLMKKIILKETLFLWCKDKKGQKKNLVVNLLELIQVKKAMMQTMKLVEYKHLSLNLETDN